jgi:hypothetical protein
MKEFLINTYDVSTDSKAIYKVKSDNLNTAKDVFKRHCIPLFCDDFDWDSMVTMFSECDINIDIVEVNNIIEL